MAELDVRGEVDAHAELCLRHGIEGALAAGARAIVVDLRDLTAIRLPAMAVFLWGRAACLAGGMPLELLISGHGSHGPIADAFARAGLGDVLRIAGEPPPPAAARRERPRRAAPLPRSVASEVAWTPDRCS